MSWFCRRPLAPLWRAAGFDRPAPLGQLPQEQAARVRALLIDAAAQLLALPGVTISAAWWSQLDAHERQALQVAAEAELETAQIEAAFAANRDGFAAEGLDG